MEKHRVIPLGIKKQIFNNAPLIDSLTMMIVNPDYTIDIDNKIQHLTKKSYVRFARYLYNDEAPNKYCMEFSKNENEEIEHVSQAEIIDGKITDLNFVTDIMASFRLDPLYKSYIVMEEVDIHLYKLTKYRTPIINTGEDLPFGYSEEELEFNKQD